MAKEKPEIFNLLKSEFKTYQNLAEKLDIKYVSVYAWFMRGGKIPNKYVARIVELTEGRITPEMIRPDLY
jgi:DNA-binding transcriptional regulator YdaS (Cro superfamily)